MAKTHPQKHTIEFQYPIKVEARPAKLHRSDKLAYLDIEKLSRARKTEFEIGHIKAGKTHRAVVAVVEKGMVTGLHMEDCPSCMSLDMVPELRSLFDEARRRLGMSDPSPSQPVPVREFLKGPVVGHCFQICAFGYCLTCCYCCSDPINEIIFAGCMITRGIPPYKLP